MQYRIFVGLSFPFKLTRVRTSSSPTGCYVTARYVPARRRNTACFHLLRRLRSCLMNYDEADSASINTSPFIRCNLAGALCRPTDDALRCSLCPIYLLSDKFRHGSKPKDQTTTATSEVNHLADGCTSTWLNGADLQSTQVVGD
jgi:hypothetical protein